MCYLYSLLPYSLFFFFFNDTATPEIYTLSLHDALPIYAGQQPSAADWKPVDQALGKAGSMQPGDVYKVSLRSEEHTSELQSRLHLVCRLLLEKKKKKKKETVRINKKKIE